MYRISAVLAIMAGGLAVAQTTALSGGTIYASPTAEPIRNGVVLIEDGRIAAVGGRAILRGKKNVQSIDCTGLTVTAGFWNSHVHFFERKWANAATIPGPELGRQLQEMLTRYGFTSVFDLGSSWENTRRLRDRIESGEVPGPKIRSTGEALISAGALPPDLVYSMMGTMKVPLPEIVDAAQAATATRKLLDAGVDGIKLMVKSPSAGKPSFPEGGIEAAVREAHRVGKPVFAHPTTGADVMAALRASVDVVAHTTPYSGPWDDATLAAIKDRRAALTPTLTLWKYYMRHDRISTEELTVNTELDQLRAWIAAGGKVLFGTDLGAVEYDPAEEYTLMAAAGMSFRQILELLTTAPTEQFGESAQRGRIAPGLQADLVVLRRDPATNIRALADVRYTLRAGKVIYQARE